MDDLYLSGYVRRVHTKQLIRSPTIAEHCWGVVKHLFCMRPRNVRKELILHGMFHDSGEFVSGDSPAPFMREHHEVKRACEEAQIDFITEQLGRELPPLNRTEKLLLEIADRLEFIDMCCLEKSLGNSTLDKQINTAGLWVWETMAKLQNFNAEVYEEVLPYVKQQLEGAAGYNGSR